MENVRVQQRNVAVKSSRTGFLIWRPNRTVVNENGECPLCFESTEFETYPNTEALKFHRVACLIWNMAGGAEPQPIDPSDEESDKDRAIFSGTTYSDMESYLSSVLPMEDEMDASQTTILDGKTVSQSQTELDERADIAADETLLH